MKPTTPLVAATRDGSPPPPLSWLFRGKPAKSAPVKSITREEIDTFWRKREVDEEEHLLEAQKAAARIRARTLKKEDYLKFEESLKCMIREEEDRSRNKGNDSAVNRNNKELEVGIQDWWTKSKYAYLNQPAIKTVDRADKYMLSYIPGSCSGNKAANQHISVRLDLKQVQC